MKKYITPNTETIEAIYGSVLCDSNSGIDPSSPTPENPTGNPGGAPKRLF
jgi:hypothetical protein